MGLTRPQAEWWPANTWVRLGPKSEAMIGRQGFMWVKCAKTAHTFTAQPRPAEDAPKEALAALAARPEEAGGEGPLSPTARREELVGEMKVLAAFAALPARTKADRPEQLLAAMNKKFQPAQRKPKTLQLTLQLTLTADGLQTKPKTAKCQNSAFTSCLADNVHCGCLIGCSAKYD
jgi:hypothetical protein